VKFRAWEAAEEVLHPSHSRSVKRKRATIAPYSYTYGCARPLTWKKPLQYWTEPKSCCQWEFKC